MTEERKMTTIYGIYSADASEIQTPGLEVVRVGALAALISEGRISLPSDPAQLTQILLEHQTAIHSVNASSILPCKLGANLPNRERVIELLELHEDTLLSELARLKDTAQINLAARWNVQDEIARAAISEDVGAFRQELLERGTVTPEDQARIGMMIGTQLERERETLLNLAIQCLKDSVLEVGNVGRGGEDSAFNLALLVKRDQLEAMENAITELDAKLEDRITWRIGAPGPAFAFASLEIITPNTLDLDRARKTLGLDNDVDGDTLARTFKKLALERHPDRNPNNPNAADEMRDLAWARDLLAASTQGLGVRVTKAVNA
jgi:Gas vesicle synthesis protein GvpL/GvpF/DnaJ domain